MKKKMLFCISAVLFLSGIGVLTSCNDDDNISTENETGSINPNLDDVKYEITDSTTLTAAEMADRIYGPEGSNADEETQKARAEFLERAQKAADAYAAKTGQNGVVTSYRWINYTYWSTDYRGWSIQLSAKVIWGCFGFNWFGLKMYTELDPNNIYLYDHYNVTDNGTIPTASCGSMEQHFGDNLAIMPDYMGFGFSKTSLHPFMNFEVNAKNSYDALAAGYKIYKEKRDGSDLEKDAKLRIYGGAVGAVYALATQKYIETNNLDEQWKLDFSYTSCGPYSASLTVDSWLERGEMEYLFYFPMLVKSMIASYPDIMKNWKEEDFYNDKYLSAKSKIDKLLAEKNKTHSDMEVQFVNLYGGEKYRFFQPISDILSDQAKQKTSPLMQDFYKCLEKNDLTKGWTPKHTMQIYQNMSEKSVFSPSNSKALKAAFGDKVNLVETKDNLGYLLEAVNQWISMF